MSTEPRRPTVHGVEVSELMLLLRQGEQAWYLSATRGNHEFAKARFEQKLGMEAPAYNIREGSARVGGGVDLTHIAVDSQGATFSWSTGAKTFIPLDYFQVSWLP